MLVRGIRRKCPQCGSGRLFHRWFTMVAACPTCSYRFERSADDAFFLGAFAINFVVTEVVLGIVIAISFALTLPDPPVGLLVVIAAAETIVVPVLFYPFSKTIWAAIDLAMFRSKA